MVADTSVNKRCRNKKTARKGRLPHRSCLIAVCVQDAQKQSSAHRPNENATYRARLDIADTSAAFDACGRRAKEDAATEKTTNKGRSNPRRKSENNAAKLPADAAAWRLLVKACASTLVLCARWKTSEDCCHIVAVAASRCLTDWVTLHTFSWLTMMLAKAEGDQMTPPAKFAAVTAAAMFGHQRSG